MIRYGKTTQHAIAAVSRLAEVYDGGQTRLNSAEIAKSRNLSQTIVAKVLTLLSQAGIVYGSPGPRGGYTLTKMPKEISLLMIAEIFERKDDGIGCPYGPGWCGKGDPCPLHNELKALQEHVRESLNSLTFEPFCPCETAAIPVCDNEREDIA